MGTCGSVFWRAEHVKQRVRYELTGLLCDTICQNASCKPTNFKTSPHRMYAIKKEMSLVRSSAEDWARLLYLGGLTSKPYHVVVCDIAKCMGVFKLGHILTFCTYINDMCVIKLRKNEHVDVYTVVDGVVKILVTKHLDVCVDFLKHLDSVPLMDL